MRNLAFKIFCRYITSSTTYLHNILDIHILLAYSIEETKKIEPRMLDVADQCETDA